MIKVHQHTYKFVGTASSHIETDESVVLKNKQIYQLRCQILESRGNPNQSQGQGQSQGQRKGQTQGHKKGHVQKKSNHSIENADNNNHNNDNNNNNNNNNDDPLDELQFENPNSGHYTDIIKIGDKFFLFDA